MKSTQIIEQASIICEYCARSTCKGILKHAISIQLTWTLCGDGYSKCLCTHLIIKFFVNYRFLCDIGKHHNQTKITLAFLQQMSESIERPWHKRQSLFRICKSNIIQIELFHRNKSHLNFARTVYMFLMRWILQQRIWNYNN